MLREFFVNVLILFHFKGYSVQYWQYYQRQQCCACEATGHGYGHGVPELTEEEGNQSQYSGEGCQHDGTEADDGGFRNGGHRFHTCVQMLLNLVNQYHAVANDGTAKRQNTKFSHKA